MNKYENTLPFENYETSIQKSGIELASTIADITSSAMLITAQPLNYEPEVFDKKHFQEEREVLLNQNEEIRECLLEQLSLRLSKKQREKNLEAVKNFLNDFDEFFPKDEERVNTRFTLLEIQQRENVAKKPFQKLTKGYESEKHEDYLIVEDALLQLTKREVYIQEAFCVYIDLAGILCDMGISPDIFEEMMIKKEQEYKLRHTMH